MDVKQIGTRLRSERLKRGMSQGDIEKRTKLLRCYLSRVECGHTMPSIETLERICVALEIPLVQLFEDPDAPSRKPGQQLCAADLEFLIAVNTACRKMNDQQREWIVMAVKQHVERLSAGKIAPKPQGLS
jgi:transcriptional regulator with XRE-family HTH domain